MLRLSPFDHVMIIVDYGDGINFMLDWHGLYSELVEYIAIGSYKNVCDFYQLYDIKIVTVIEKLLQNFTVIVEGHGMFSLSRQTDRLDYPLYCPFLFVSSLDSLNKSLMLPRFYFGSLGFLTA